MNLYLATKKALWEELLQYYLVTTDLKEAQRQKEEFHVSLILAGLDPMLEPYKAQILAGEELPTIKIMIRRLNRSFLGHSSVVLSIDSFALVTSAGGHSSGRGGGRGDGGCAGRDGSRGDSRGGGRGGGDGGRGGGRCPPQRCSYCGMNVHTEDYC